MRLIVTRPAAQAAGWVQALQALGQDAVALPLIGIAPAPDAAAVRQAWRQLAQRALVVFVSPNAVQQFFALAPGDAGLADAAGQPPLPPLPPTPRWPAGVLAGSTGPGTSAALRAAGVPEAQLVEPAADAPSFDSEALWAQLCVRGWARADVDADADDAAVAKASVLIVRGDGGRNWLADTLRAHGASVDAVAAYQRHPPQLGAAQQALLQAAVADPAAHLWLFSSSEALQHLHALAPAADWSRSRAMASHARIVQSVQAAGFGQVTLVAPAPEAVVTALAAPAADT